MTLRPYIAALLITAAMFLAAFGVSALLNERRVEELKTMEERLALDILSLETQFDLFDAVSCEQLKENNPMTAELGELGARLAFMEGELGADDPRVVQLKKTYSLLSIKDLVLLRRMRERCGFGPLPLLYFYSNTPGACPSCKEQGYVLTRLAREVPEIRIYAFDYDLPLSALDIFEALTHVTPPLPVLHFEGKTVHGFHSLEALMEVFPLLATLRQEPQQAATSTASQTPPATSTEERR